MFICVCLELARKLRWISLPVYMKKADQNVKFTRVCWSRAEFTCVQWKKSRPESRVNLYQWQQNRLESQVYLYL